MRSQNISWTAQYSRIAWISSHLVCALALATLPLGCCIGGESDRIDVVPASWAIPGYSPSTTAPACVFPVNQVNPAIPTNDYDHTFTDFFPKDSVFPEKGSFDWPPLGCRIVHVETKRDGSNLEITIPIKSVCLVRKLSWSEFRAWRNALYGWFFVQNGLLFPCSNSAYSVSVHNHVGDMLATLLADSRYDDPSSEQHDFVDQQLNEARQVTYVGNVEELSELKASLSMNARRIDAGQILRITWGGMNVYPGSPTTQYSRAVSVGTTELRVLSQDGMLLIPRSSLRLQAEPESRQPVAGSGVMLPYALSLQDQFGTTFVPIFNLFDLHDEDLLVSHTDNGISAPKYLFLLQPLKYFKPDYKDWVVQFDYDARAGIHVTPRDEIPTLARQFFIIGTNHPDLASVEREWSCILEKASRRLINVPATEPTSDAGGFIHAAFAGRTFVELESHYSINGHSFIEDDRTTLGHALEMYAELDPELQGSPNLPDEITIHRSAAGTRHCPSKDIVIILHSPSKEVLNETVIREGDQIYVNPLP